MRLISKFFRLFKKSEQTVQTFVSDLYVDDNDLGYC